ncbi:hypothetical protein HDU96_005127 [Phlyctochytrium bullatum]|nr:hypothetical protein HDU96_005127 [Phlyctochytrium bullatum]
MAPASGTSPIATTRQTVAAAVQVTVTGTIPAPAAVPPPSPTATVVPVQISVVALPSAPPSPTLPTSAAAAPAPAPPTAAMNPPATLARPPTGVGVAAVETAPPLSLSDILKGVTSLTTCATGCLGNLFGVINNALTASRLADVCNDPNTVSTLGNCARSCPDDNQIFGMIQTYCNAQPKPSPLPTARTPQNANSAAEPRTLPVANAAAVLFSVLVAVLLAF